MVNVRVEEHEAFRTVGRKTWISGTDNEQFGTIWDDAHNNGLVDELKSLSTNADTNTTRSTIFGISRVEKDPDNRAFFFYVSSESESQIGEDLEEYTVPACKWAIFSNTGELPMSLVDAEMYAYMKWLPTSGYRHAHAPELEVYPERDSSLVEYWLPIEEAL